MEHEEATLPPGLLPLPATWRELDKDTVAVMDRYLPRSSSPKDLIQWPVSAHDGSSSSTTPGTASASAGPSSTSSSSQTTFCNPVLGMLRSKHSKHEAFVLFVNNTPHTVRLLWVDYLGQEVAYDVLPAGHSCIQHTFATHPWVVREVKTATRLLFNGHEAFCPRRMVVEPRQQQQQQLEAPEPAAPAAAPAGDAAEEGPQGVQQQQEQRYFDLQISGGVRRVPRDLLQRAEITKLPPLAWSETTHKHVPGSFKAAARTFLLCHLHLQQALAAGHSSADAPAAFSNTQPASPSSSSHTHLGHIPTLLLTAIVSKAAPFTPQHLDLPAVVRPDILPTRLPEELSDEPPQDWPHAQFAFNFDDEGDVEEWSDEEEDVEEGQEGAEEEEGLADGALAEGPDGQAQQLPNEAVGVNDAALLTDNMQVDEFLP